MPPRGRGQGRRSEFFILSDFYSSITVFVQNRNVNSIKSLKKLHVLYVYRGKLIFQIFLSDRTWPEAVNLMDIGMVEMGMDFKMHI